MMLFYPAGLYPPGKFFPENWPAGTAIPARPVLSAGFRIITDNKHK
jgi:hypothetical protein